MSINLRAFRKITNGFARGHHFNLGIIDFKGIGDNKFVNYGAGAVLSPLMSIFCSAMTLPQRNLEDEQLMIQYGIPAINMPTRVSYPGWSVTFYSDELALLRYLFIRWQEKIVSSRTKTFGVPATYKSQLAYAALLSPQDIPTHVYTFHGLYPRDVQGIQVSQSDTDVLTFSVEFAYDYFVINEPIGYAASLAHEVVFDTVLNRIFGDTNNFKHKRSVNAPLGISIKLPL